jgi:hypothetical protein
VPASAGASETYRNRIAIRISETVGALAEASAYIWVCDFLEGREICRDLFRTGDHRFRVPRLAIPVVRHPAAFQ